MLMGLLNSTVFKLTELKALFLSTNLLHFLYYTNLTVF